LARPQIDRSRVPSTGTKLALECERRREIRLL
jgi:hypothetical protein